MMRADGGVDDVAHRADAEADAELRQQPAGHHRADDADDDVAEQAEAAARDDQAGNPAGDRADDQRRNDNHRIPPATE